MFSNHSFPRRTLLFVLAVGLAAYALPSGLVAQAGQAPGGFVEMMTSAVARQQPSASQIAGFVPASRGRFSFPAPYSTEGYRITIPSDCAGVDCIQQEGYSFWRNINAHAGQPMLRLFVGLQDHGYVTMFTVDKATGTVTNNGSIFGTPTASNPLSYSRGGGWFWSGTDPDILYAYATSQLVARNVVTGAQTVVLDLASTGALAAHGQGTGVRVWAAMGSDDGNSWAMTVRSTSTGQDSGCALYHRPTNAWHFILGPMGDCFVDRSGAYWTASVGGASAGTDLRKGTMNPWSVGDLLTDPQGAPGHLDHGWGFMLGEDNWNAMPQALRLWDLSLPYGATGQGRVVHHMTQWGSDTYVQPTIGNGQPATLATIGSQYGCSTTTFSVTPSSPAPREREIVCFPLDGSGRMLVVAPNMTNMSASGGSIPYYRAPKGNLDKYGQYYYWITNMGGNRLEAFLVRVPFQVLMGGGSGDTTLPTVSLAAPANGATVSGAVAVSATASDNVGVTGVQFRLDGANLGAEDTTSPYSINWTTTTTTNGSHTLTAVARDAAGNTTTAASRTVTVSNAAPGDTTAPTVALSAPASGATVSATVAVSATASDNVGVVGVQFRLDGANLGAEDMTSPYSINWNTTTTVNGSHTLTAVARDAAGNTTTAASRTVTVNNAGPSLGGLVAAYGYNEGGGTTTADWSPTGNAATLVGASWAAGQFGSALSTSGASFAEAADNDALTPGTTATFSAWVYLTGTPGEVASIVNKWSQSGEDEYLFGLASDRSPIFAWQTTAGAGWGTPGFNYAMGTGQVALNTWTHVAVVRDSTALRFYVNGTLTSSTTPMDGNPFRNGSNSLRVGGQNRGTINRYFPGRIDELRIYSAALTAAQIQADMNSAIGAPGDTTQPDVSISAPANGATVSGSVPVSASASDNVGVVGVLFRVDGVGIGSEVTSAPWAIPWASTGVANGSHALTAIARDAAGHTRTSSAITVTVQNSTADTTAPTVALSAPASGATVSATVAVSATASDNVGVTGVQFRLDGANLGAEDTTSPYSINWTTTTTTNGSHTLTAVARDAAGNTTTAASRTVTVSNAAPVGGAVAAYAFNEGTGTTTADASPTGNVATLTGSTWGAGRFGNALSTNGAGYANAPDVAALTPGANATFEAWVFMTSAPTDLGSILNKWSQSAEDEYLFGVLPDRRVFFTWKTTAATVWGTPSFNEAMSTGLVPLNVWTHVAIVRTGATLSFYLNGVLSSSVAAMDTNPFRNGTNSLRVGGQGRGGANRYFPGRIDEVRIYNRALTVVELQTDMNTPIGAAPPPSPIGFSPTVRK